MSNVTISVGGDFEKEAAESFVEAWKRAERGETFSERHFAFENWETLTRVITAKRLEVLRHVHRNPTKSIRALAKALGRDYSNVHADVRALQEAGLLEEDDGMIIADYDVIETKIAI